MYFEIEFRSKKDLEIFLKYQQPIYNHRLYYVNTTTAAFGCFGAETVATID